jgi:hypothetical protein
VRLAQTSSQAHSLHSFSLPGACAAGNFSRPLGRGDDLPTRISRSPVSVAYTTLRGIDHTVL